MADLYADEQFPKAAVGNLRDFDHDVLTVQDAGKRGDSDKQVLEFATEQTRAVITINRKDFIRLHRENSEHGGIIACKQDNDWQRLATNVNQVIIENEPLKGKLIRVKRKA